MNESCLSLLSTLAASFKLIVLQCSMQVQIIWKHVSSIFSCLPFTVLIQWTISHPTWKASPSQWIMNVKVQMEDSWSDGMEMSKSESDMSLWSKSITHLSFHWSGCQFLQGCHWRLVRMLGCQPEHVFCGICTQHQCWVTSKSASDAWTLLLLYSCPCTFACLLSFLTNFHLLCLSWSSPFDMFLQMSFFVFGIGDWRTELSKAAWTNTAANQ